MAIPPLTIYIDNAGVVNGCSRGKAWCTAAARPAADLWRQVWRRMEDIGSGITILKCKGHATEADVTAGRATALTRAGNANADFFAGCGVTMAEHAAPAERSRLAYREATRWYRWLGVLAGNLPQDTTKRAQSLGDGEAAKQERRIAQELQKSSGSRPPEASASEHLIATGDRRMACTLCRRFVDKQASKSRKTQFINSRCGGALVDRVRASRVGRESRDESGIATLRMEASQVGQQTHAEESNEDHGSAAPTAWDRLSRSGPPQYRHSHPVRRPVERQAPRAPGHAFLGGSLSFEKPGDGQLAAAASSAGGSAADADEVFDTELGATCLRPRGRAAVSALVAAIQESNARGGAGDACTSSGMS